MHIRIGDKVLEPAAGLYSHKKAARKTSGQLGLSVEKLENTRPRPTTRRRHEGFVVFDQARSQGIYCCGAGISGADTVKELGHGINLSLNFVDDQNIVTCICWCKRLILFSSSNRI